MSFQKPEISNRLTIVLFIIYLVALCWILLLKLGVQFSYMGNRRVNLIPFNQGYFHTSELVMNVVIFMPLGIYTGVLFNRWGIGKQFFFFFFVSLIVESLQYILAVGAFDITDVITNTLGGLIGFGIFKAVEAAFNNSHRTRIFINIIATTGTALMTLMLLLLKMNMLPVRYQ